MKDIILLFGALGFTFLMTKKEGPFDILEKTRAYFIANKYIGVPIYKLLNCAFCSGFWFGLLFQISVEGFSVFSIVFAFACAFASYLVSLMMS